MKETTLKTENSEWENHSNNDEITVYTIENPNDLLLENDFAYTESQDISIVLFKCGFDLGQA